MRFLRALKFILRHPLNRGHSVGAMLRFLMWQMTSRILTKAVVIDYVNGTRLLVERGMTSATGALYTGLLEYSDMMFVLHVLREGDLFVDIGANIGSYTVLAGSIPGVRVEAFEPDQDAHRCLVDNVMLNRAEDRVVVHRMGVGRINSVMHFTRGHGQVNHVVAGPQDQVGSVEILVKPLDDLIWPSQPIVIKMDVEGYESEVIAGARRILSDPAVKCLLIEFNGSGTRYGQDEGVILEELKALGFRVLAYSPEDRVLVDPSRAVHRSKNQLLVRDADWASKRVRSGPRVRIRDREI